jgi:hypothetical protein
MTTRILEAENTELNEAKRQVEARKVVIEAMQSKLLASNALVEANRILSEDEF